MEVFLKHIEIATKLQAPFSSTNLESAGILNIEAMPKRSVYDPLLFKVTRVKCIHTLPFKKLRALLDPPKKQNVPMPWDQLYAGIKRFNTNTYKILDAPESIIEAYSTDNYSYSSNGGNIKSCMTRSNTRGFTQFYADNGVKIVTSKNSEGRINARALLWPKVRIHDSKNTVQFLDRIYYEDIANYYAMALWAMENDVYYRIHGYVLHADQILMQRSAFKAYVQLKYGKYPVYPYADTFTCLRVSTKTIASYFQGPGSWALRSEDGGLKGLTDTGGVTSTRRQRFECTVDGKVWNHRTYRVESRGNIRGGKSASQPQYITNTCSKCRTVSAVMSGVFTLNNRYICATCTSYAVRQGLKLKSPNIRKCTGCKVYTICINKYYTTANNRLICKDCLPNYINTVKRSRDYVRFSNKRGAR